MTDTRKVENMLLSEAQQRGNTTELMLTRSLRFTAPAQRYRLSHFLPCAFPLKDAAQLFAKVDAIFVRYASFAGLSVRATWLNCWAIKGI